MKILTIASLLPVPDLIAENDYVLVLAEKIKECRDDISFLFIRPSPYIPLYKRGKWKNRYSVKNLKDYLIKNERIYVLPYIAIGSINFLLALTSFTSLLFNKKKLIQFAENIDFTHAHYFFPDGLIALYLKRKINIPFIITLHTEQRLFTNWFSKYISRKILDNAKHIICINPLMKNFLQTKEGYNNIAVIGHGIEQSFFNQQYSYNFAKEIKILSIGNLYWVKNFEKTIEAVEILASKYPVHFTLVGSGELENKLQQIVMDKKLQHNISFVPSIKHEEMAGLMANHDIFILASHKETWGRVYFEAMAVALPVILTKNTGAYSLITENENALVVNPDDIEDITEKLEYLIKNPDERRRIGENGKSLSRSFTWQAIANKYLNMYVKS